MITYVSAQFNLNSFVFTKINQFQYDFTGEGALGAGGWLRKPL